MPVYDYGCENGHITEARRGFSVTSIPCATCGTDAQRRSVYRFGVSGVPQPKYRLTEYQEAGQEANYYHERMEQDRGQPLAQRDLVRGAIKQARAQGAKVKSL